MKRLLLEHPFLVVLLPAILRDRVEKETAVRLVYPQSAEHQASDVDAVVHRQVRRYLERGAERLGHLETKELTLGSGLMQFCNSDSAL